MISSKSLIQCVVILHRNQRPEHSGRIPLIAKSRKRPSLVHRYSSVLTNPLTSTKIKDDSAPHLSLCFSPGGFLIPYYLGVIYCLRRLGLLSVDTPICGTSAGALAAAFVISGASFTDCMGITKGIQQQLLDNGYGQKVIDILRIALEDFLPEDIHGRASGKVGIGVTVYSPGKSIVGRVLTDFTTKTEFVDAVAASCYIPYFLGPKLGIERENGCIYSDGMPTTFFPEFPPDSSSTPSQTLTISALPKPNRALFDRRSVDISPDLRHPSDIPSVWKILWNGLVPLRLDEIDEYALKGYSDTVLWAQDTLTQNTNNNLNIEEIKQELSLLMNTS